MGSSLQRYFEGWGKCVVAFDDELCLVICDVLGGVVDVDADLCARADLERKGQ